MANFWTDLPTSARMETKPGVRVTTYPNGDQHVLIRWGKLRLSMDIDEANNLANEVISALTRDGHS